MTHASSLWTDIHSNKWSQLNYTRPSSFFALKAHRLDCLLVLYLQDLWTSGTNSSQRRSKHTRSLKEPVDVFNPIHLNLVPPVVSARTPTGPPEKDPIPDLRNLTSHNPLHGWLSAIHAFSLFLFFGEEKLLARALTGPL